MGGEGGAGTLCESGFFGTGQSYNGKEVAVGVGGVGNGGQGVAISLRILRIESHGFYGVGEGYMSKYMGDFG